MPRTIAYIPFYTSASAPESLVTSRDIGLPSMDDDFIYGVRGKGERDFLDRAMSSRRYETDLTLRQAKICLDVESKFQGFFDPLTGLKNLRFFGGEDERIDVQSAVGALWHAVAQEDMQAQGKDYRQLSRKIDFRRARDFMRALPQHAEEVARRAQFVAMTINLPLFGHSQRPRVIMIQRKFAQDAVKWAEFEDRRSPVCLEVPTPDGMRVLELARMPKLQWHMEETPTKMLPGSLSCLHLNSGSEPRPPGP